ncbi:hypothetical protein IGI57_002571 [Enterococcus sp. DIV0213j]|uniref:antitoxin n=1 Tax=Enterococcus sp. DIV0213j TaxID=2774649 RepID=UPI003D2AE601
MQKTEPDYSEMSQMRIRSCERELEELQKTRNVLTNPTAREAIDKHIENLRQEVHQLKIL